MLTTGEVSMKRNIWVIILILLPIVALSGKSGDTHEYTLKNGLKLIVREDHRAPVVLSSVWYRVGSSYEHNGITGISHMLEHMMFKGTKQFEPGVLVKTVTDNGGQQNAMTSYDFTAYYQMWTADKLPLSFKFESDRMRHLQFDQKLFEKEHQVVMEERRMRVDDDPQALMQERFNAAAFVNNPYHHPVIGWMTDIKNYTLANLKDWYQTWYAPNNAIVIVVGDVNPNKVLYQAKRYFGHLKRGVIPQTKPRTEVNGLGERHITVSLPAKLPMLVMGYTVPVLKTAQHSWQPYALDMLANILSAGDSARLPSMLVRGDQIAVEASAYYDLYRLHNGLFILSGTPTVTHTVAQLKAALLTQIRKLQQKPVTIAELDRVKAQMIASNVYQKDSLMYQMYDIGIPETLGLSWKSTRDYVDEISKITPAQIQAVAEEFLNTNGLTVAVLKPLPINQGDQQHG